VLNGLAYLYTTCESQRQQGCYGSSNAQSRTTSRRLALPSTPQPEEGQQAWVIRRWQCDWEDRTVVIKLERTKRPCLVFGQFSFLGVGALLATRVVLYFVASRRTRPSLGSNSMIHNSNFILAHTLHSSCTRKEKLRTRRQQDGKVRTISNHYHCHYHHRPRHHFHHLIIIIIIIIIISVSSSSSSIYYFNFFMANKNGLFHNDSTIRFSSGKPRING